MATLSVVSTLTVFPIAVLLGSWNTFIQIYSRRLEIAGEPFWYLWDKEKRQLFDKGLLDYLRKMDFTPIPVVIDKGSHIETDFR
jgi:hypothetical protein